MSLSQISKAQCEEFYTDLEGNSNLDGNFPHDDDTLKFAQQCMRSSHVAISEAEITRKEEMLNNYVWDNGECSSCGYEALLSNHPYEVENGVIERDLTYLKEELEAIRSN
jgi:hypothetical protein